MEFPVLRRHFPDVTHKGLRRALHALRNNGLTVEDAERMSDFSLFMVPQLGRLGVFYLRQYEKRGRWFEEYEARCL
jgi:hypothetical protein